MSGILRPVDVIRSAFLSFALLALVVGCIERREKAYGDAGQDQDTTQAFSRDSLVIELTGVDSMTVFDLLQAGHQVHFQNSAMGVFIESIDSIGYAERIYWVYSVNDSMGQVACDQYVTREGDRIKWHFRKMGE